MTTAAVAAALLILAVLDGTFAGFRSSLGRTGLLDHRRSDYRASVRGGVLVLALLALPVVAASADAIGRPHRRHLYRRAGEAMLVVYGPYAALVLLALLVYATLGWRLKYLASAVILGPFTLIRPVIAVGGALLAAVAADDVLVTVIGCLAVGAVLAVEPIADRVWFADRTVTA